jgi:hypothetical protein
MPQPVDFTSGLLAGQRLVTDYQLQQTQNLLGQMQARQAGAQMDADARAQAQEDAFQNDLDHVLAGAPDPNAYRRLMLRYPKFATQLKAQADAMDASQRQTDFTQAAEIYSAARNGKFDLAAQQLEKRINADRAAGQGVADDEQMLQWLRSEDPMDRNAAINMIGMHVSSFNPQQFGNDIGQLAEERTGKTTAVTPGTVLTRDNPLTGAVEEVYRSPFKPEYIKGEDGSIIMLSGGGGDTPPGGGAPSSTPRGIRNNNPGNLKFGPFAKSMGATGADADGFAIFPDTSAGTRAQENLLLGSGYFGGGRRTIASIISKYAPASDGNSVGDYAKFVAKETGIAPNQPLNTADIPRVAAAMRKFENGAQSASNSRGGKTPPPPPGFVLDK